MQEIRDAFAANDWEKASQLTRKNFNSPVPYESYAEDPFRFGSFTTMGEAYIETGLSTVGMSDYRRALSLDSALASVSFVKDGVKYQREYFISYPANVMAIRYKASRQGKQNLVFSYAPNPSLRAGWWLMAETACFGRHVSITTICSMPSASLPSTRAAAFLMKAES